MINLHKLVPVAVLNGIDSSIQDANRWAAIHHDDAFTARHRLEAMFHIDAKTPSSKLFEWLHKNNKTFEVHPYNIYILLSNAGCYIAMQMLPSGYSTLSIGDATLFIEGRFIPWWDNTQKVDMPPYPVNV